MFRLGSHAGSAECTDKVWIAQGNEDGALADRQRESIDVMMTSMIES